MRFSPRVKHNWKHAINSVELITLDEFIRGHELQDNDLYFQVTNSSEQKFYGAIVYEQVFDYDMPEKKARDRDRIFYSKMARIQRRDLNMRLAEVVK